MFCAQSRKSILKGQDLKPEEVDCEAWISSHDTRQRDCRNGLTQSKVGAEDDCIDRGHTLQKLVVRVHQLYWRW